MKSIAGFDNLDVTTITELKIFNNPFLATCEEDWVCEFISNNGVLFVGDNASGCENSGEVKEACGLSIGDIEFENGFSISPNPFSSTIVISYTLHKNESATIEIQNMNGQVVETIVPENINGINHEITFDVSGLLPGVYFCVLKTNEGMQTKKMIKL